MTYKLKNKKVILVPFMLLACLAVVALFFTGAKKTSPSDIKTYSVNSDLFEIKITETGELKAIRSVLVSAPRIRSKLQIVRLAEEGSIVREGDLLIELDNAELQKTASNREAELLKTIADLTKTEAEEHLLELELDRAILQSELELVDAENELKKSLHGSKADKEIAHRTRELKEKSLEIQKLKKLRRFQNGMRT